jgi:two-component system, chemotaxis family, protein-glutamate methylesterase/glutaminase
MTKTSGIIRVLVVDDSAFVRKVIKQMLARSPFIEVVGTARDGREALELVISLKPDVVTLDLMMPGLDGIGFLKEQMARRPIAVIVCSIAHESGAVALEALEAGAVDFVQKPTALATDRIYEMGDELVAKVKAASEVRLPLVQLPVPVRSRPVPIAAIPGRIGVDIVVIGVSTGGPQGLRQVIPQLSADFPVPVAIVLHMPIGYTAMYAQRLNELSPLAVSEASQGDAVKAGVVLIAPAGRHMTFRRQADGSVRVHLDVRPTDSPYKPSVDELFRSAAEVYAGRVLGIVMTGMGNDGTAGSRQIKSAGGQVLTESESSCVVYGMPRAVVEAQSSDRSAPLTELPQSIMEMLQ